MLKEHLERLLKYTEEFPTSQIFVEFSVKSRPRFALKSVELGDILRSVLFEVPTLREALDAASKDIETLQEQIAGETPSSERLKWEYAEVGIDINSDYIALFDRLGDDGWELTPFVPEKDAVVFKRPK